MNGMEHGMVQHGQMDINQQFKVCEMQALKIHLW